jgi:adenylate kinase family enzyme
MKVAFVGKAGSGKTTLTNYLVNKHGFVKLSFATKIKEFASQILQEPVDKFNPAHRRFLQEFGLLAREVDPEIWIKWAKREIDILEKEGKNIAVDDCRYPNEGVFLRQKGFILIRLVGRAYDMEVALKQHKSETEMDKIQCDFELDATKPLEEETVDLESVIARAQVGSK